MLDEVKKEKMSKDKIKLVKLSEEYKELLFEMMEEWTSYGNG